MISPGKEIDTLPVPNGFGLSKYGLLTKLVLSRWLDIGQVLFFCALMDRDGVEIHKLAKKERGQYPAILTEQAWSVQD